MDLPIQIYLEDKNGCEQELSVLVDFDGDIAKDCDGYNVHIPCEQNTVVVWVEFAGIQWPNFDLLLECHFIDYSIHTIHDMIYEAVNDELTLIYETKFC
jgi:hypothetical protein